MTLIVLTDLPDGDVYGGPVDRCPMPLPADLVANMACPNGHAWADLTDNTGVTLYQCPIAESCGNHPMRAIRLATLRHEHVLTSVADELGAGIVTAHDEPGGVVLDVTHTADHAPLGVLVDRAGRARVVDGPRRGLWLHGRALSLAVSLAAAA